MLMKKVIKKINILIVHYNTPKLTECLVKSINKYVGMNCHIYIFDNSDGNPFTYKQKNITVFDNTRGQIIDFDAFLKKHKNKPRIALPDKGRCISARHCLSVDKCFDLIDNNFILLDSDVLLTSDIRPLFNPEFIFQGQLETNDFGAQRVAPYCCFINVKKCQEYNIRYYDENMMHGISMGNGNRYDTGASFFYHTKNHPYNLINLNDFIVHYKGASWDPNYSNNFKIHGNLSPDKWLEKNKKYYSDKVNKKVIYTCITGNYEKLSLPSHIDTDFDYVCFTDNLEQNNGVWELRPIPKSLIKLSKVKQQRIIKICPHKYLSEYNESIWVDGCIDILSSMNDFISEYCDQPGKSVFIKKHPSRNCIYDEAKACIALKKDTAEHINPQIERYRKEGFPSKFGLVESNIIYRKHNEPYCAELMEAWAKEVLNESHRDQLSFNYALWKIGDEGFVCLDKNVTNGKYFKWYPQHNRSGMPNNPKELPLEINDESLTLVFDYPITTKRISPTATVIQRDINNRTLSNKRHVIPNNPRVVINQKRNVKQSRMHFL